jgi:hypothetical protein
MDFLDISSLSVSYRYVVEIEKKFKYQNKWEFRSANPQQNASRDILKKCTEI